MSNIAAEKAFCPICRKDVGFRTVLVECGCSIDGREYAFPAKQAVCSICGAEAVLSRYTEENGRAFNAVVKRENGLAPTAVVRELADLAGGVAEAASLSGVPEEAYRILMDGLAPSPSDSKAILEAWEALRA